MPAASAASTALMFTDGYVELCGIIDPAGDNESLGRFLPPGGPVVARAAHLGLTTHAAWQAAGLGPGEVTDDERTMEPDLELRCKDVLREGLRRLVACRCSPARISTPSVCAARKWLGHPNGARAIARSRSWSKSRRLSSTP